MNTIRELTIVEELGALYSDLYKDAHGFRPRGHNPEFWNNEAALRAAIAELDAIMPAIMAEEKAREADCVKRFEALVERTIGYGAGDRKTALRWIMDSSNCDGDWEYLCFCHGLPYHYFKDADK